ncbi:hypothetical protein BASA83_000082 [Batrachochytrium salamandrivorans]|nr:hypothetical protein BASA83_000082 [Batrachochytrium salamandrivorans]
MRHLPSTFVPNILSRLIITFLCAAAIGSVSGAFLTFKPAQFVLKDITAYTSFSVKLNSKPTEEVTVYFHHRSMSMSKCMIVFNPNDWNVEQHIDVVPAPLFLGSSLLPVPLEAESKILARAVAVGPLPPELSSIDTMEVRQTLIPFYRCSTTDNGIETFDSLVFTFNKPDWYWMLSTGDLEIQVKVVKCTEKQLCVTHVIARYGSTAMSMDVSGSVKDISKYSMTYVTSSTNGMQYTPEPKVGSHILNFPYGSSLEVKVIKIMQTHGQNLWIKSHQNLWIQVPSKPVDPVPSKPVDPVPSKPVDPVPSKPVDPVPSKPVDPVPSKPVDPVPSKPVDPVPSKPVDPVPSKPVDPVPSKPVDPVPSKPVDPVPSKPVDPVPSKPVDQVPSKPVDQVPSKPVDPVPSKPVDQVPSKPTTTTTTTTITTTTTTTSTTTAVATTTTTTSTTTTTTPHSTSTIYLPPPSPGGYVPPVPPPPPPDVVAEIQKCCQSIFNIPSCNAIVPTESYIQSCISDAQTSGSYVFSDKVKQTYLAKCRTLTDDMIRGTTKEAIDQGTKIRKEYGFGNVTCINSCSGQGTCTDFGCACSPGFSGMDCSMDLTKATQYDPTVDQYRINVNITVVQHQMEQHSKLPVSDPYATPAPSAISIPSIPSISYSPYGPSVPSDPYDPSVDQSLASFVGSLSKPSTVSPQIAKESQPPYPDSYDDFQKPIISSAISFGSLHMVSAAAVVITSYILLL